MLPNEEMRRHIVTKADKSSASESRQKYEPSEHKDIGNKALCKIFERYQLLKQELDGFIDSATLVISQEQVQMTAGEWVSLAGDFYGIVNRPISGLPNETIIFDESKRRFEEAYTTLAGVTQNEKSELNKLLTEIREEEREVAIAKQKGLSVSKVLHERSAISNPKYAEITANSVIARFLVSQMPLAITGLSIDTRYLSLSETNFDHFGNDAKTAYRAGHEVALMTAAIAKKFYDDKNFKEWKKYFTRALTQELFACHFLTDLFSSGHMRVPRKEMVRVLKNYKIAGLLALIMHNEDGENGLWVTSRKYGERWLARGDGCFHDHGVELNKERAIEAVTNALNSIYEASVLDFEKRAKFDFEDYIPTPLPANADMNPSPLFVVTDNKINRRNDIYSSKCYNHISNWNQIPTLARLWMFKESASTQVDENKAIDLEKRIEGEVKSDKDNDNETTKNSCSLL